MTGSRLIIAIGRDLVVSGVSESGSSWFGPVEQVPGEARVVSGRWWRSEFASLGMAMPAPGWVLRQGDLKCGLWGGWWPASARERCAVDVLCWDLEDVGGCVGLVWGLVGVAPLVEDVVVGDGDEQRDQDGLGDAAVGEPVLRISQVEVVAFETAVQPSVIALAAEYVPRHEGLR
ncbi:hypothetical protein [Nonomuraea sp. 10N515B]|uniref:hypothetical protein n=1 Tax=Nonomuraea sp. 10N515B TaxID=3457422 RepID=UPI003FCD391D